MEDDEEDWVCPLCVEDMDESDRNFLPCPCGYRVCMWCWHHIREDLNGLCPACRTPYNEDPHAFSAVDRQDVAGSAAVGCAGGGGGVPDRRHLQNYRVVQRNLVYVIGWPLALSAEEVVRRKEHFGRFGKICKVQVITPTGASKDARGSVTVYVTFTHRDDARAAIEAIDGQPLSLAYQANQVVLRASFGTTKYCSAFLRSVACHNQDCVYLHSLGDDDDRFTKEEIQA
ncbi:RING/Ubox like zinc-binding domain-containing protein, partial [Ochromonadaceae sp. CCMP2298]